MLCLCCHFFSYSCATYCGFIRATFCSTARASLGPSPLSQGKGGKNRRRGKNEGEDKRELETKEEGQVRRCCVLFGLALGLSPVLVVASHNAVHHLCTFLPFALAPCRSMPR